MSVGRGPQVPAALVFDDRGIAVDGRLQHPGEEDAYLDLRESGLVAVLVSRSAIAPDALHDDDDAIRVNLLRAIRVNRLWVWLAIAAPVAWLLVGILGVVLWVDGQAKSLLPGVMPLVIVALYVVMWFWDRQRMRRVTRQ